MELLAFMLVVLVGGIFAYGIYKFVYGEFVYKESDSFEEIKERAAGRGEISLFGFFRNLIPVWKKSKKSAWDYELAQFREVYFQKKLMNRSEFTFFCLLQKKLPPNCTLFSKVRMEDFVGADESNVHYFHFRGYIKSRHVDFLICDKTQKMKPVLAIELDGKYHRTLRQQEVDNRKDKIYRAIGLKLERIRVGENFEEAIEERVLSCV